MLKIMTRSIEVTHNGKVYSRDEFDIMGQEHGQYLFSTYLMGEETDLYKCIYDFSKACDRKMMNECFSYFTISKEQRAALMKKFGKLFTPHKDMKYAIKHRLHPDGLIQDIGDLSYFVCVDYYSPVERETSDYQFEFYPEGYQRISKY